MRLLTTILLLAFALAGCGAESSESIAAARQWETVEWVHPDAPIDANPFDDDGVTVAVDLRSPAGDGITIDAFVYRGFTREIVGGYEHLTPTGPAQWRARFTPPSPGTWSWRWRVTDATGSHAENWAQLDVKPAAASSHGLVRRSNADSRYLRFDDGTPYFPIGENLCWYNGGGTFDYERWLDRLADQGANYVRLWMPSWAFGLEWIERDASGAFTGSSLGNYESRLDRAWQLDQVMEAAQRRGIQVMLSIQNHGAFSLTNNSEWDDNPYNASNGGPLTAPRELFTNPEARALFKRRLRYIVARWGAAPNLMSWELWNEVDLVDQPPLEALTDWHREMAGEIRRRDPYEHLVSTSTGQGDALSPSSPFGALWQLDDLDFTQAHFYGVGGTATDFTVVFPRIANRLRRYEKPFFVAEAGVDFRGVAETIAADPNGDGFHDLLWSAPFSGAFGAGMTWWWDGFIDPLNLYSHFGPLVHLVRGIDFPNEGIEIERNSISASGRSLSVATLRGRDVILVWIKNARDLWTTPDPATIDGAVLSMGIDGDDIWEGEWVDTRSGARQPVVSTAGESGRSLTVPAFVHDIALRLDRLAPVDP